VTLGVTLFEARHLLMPGVHMRNPYTLFKKKAGNGLIWYARFWNDKAGKYTLARSTGIYAEGKKERKREAELKAQEMLKEIRFETGAADRSLVSYLEDFWKFNSPYVKTGFVHERNTGKLKRHIQCRRIA
jgi:hypothetical protein